MLLYIKNNIKSIKNFAQKGASLLGGICYYSNVYEVVVFRSIVCVLVQFPPLLSVIVSFTSTLPVPDIDTFLFSVFLSTLESVYFSSPFTVTTIVAVLLTFVLVVIAILNLKNK